MNGVIKKPRKPHIQESFQGRAVAKEVIKRVREGKKVNMQEIQKAHGYSAASAKSMKATFTRSYKEEIANVLTKMDSLRIKTLDALHAKDLNDAKVFDLNLLLKNLNHDIQLLQGRSTENLATATQVVVFGSDDFLAMQMAKKDRHNNGLDTGIVGL